MKSIRRLAFFFLLLYGFLLSCTTQSPPPETRQVSPVVSLDHPSARLLFDRIEAVTPDSISLLFHLEAENPRNEAAQVRAAAFNVTVNGVEQKDAGGLALEGETLAAGSSGTYPLRLETALTEKVLSGLPGPAGEAALRADITFTYASGEEVTISVDAAAPFPVIRKPAFQITAIAVKKAELINTRFKVSLKIDNPNGFPLELSSFTYELYNAGRFWADGIREDILMVPPESSAETDIFLTMNFINMNRELLNQIANLHDIDYRFTGEASVSAGMEYAPQFTIAYDLSGHSPVIE
jgi:LEA14-like dessication related protein